MLKTNLSVRNNSSCLRGTGVIDKGALDCTFMGVMFLVHSFNPHIPPPPMANIAHTSTQTTPQLSGVTIHVHAYTFRSG